MALPYSKHFSTKKTPQSEPIPGSNQVPNSAGGYSFQVDDWTRLQRFLILGSEGGSYYASEKKLTKDNAEAVLRCIGADGSRVVSTIVAISDSGRAPKNSPALFALALASALGDTNTKRGALNALPMVARTGTHLFEFVEYVQNFRGWGRSLTRAIGNWYEEKELRDLAYQCAKYQQRNGWSHADLLRLCHVKAQAPRSVSGQTPGGKPLFNYDHTDNPRAVLYRWILKGWDWVGEEAHPNPALHPVWAMERAKRATSSQEVIKLIRDYNLVRECIPTQYLTDPNVWEALLERMPLTAMVRNLGVMSSCGLLAPLSEASKKVVEELGNRERLKKARVHPLALLLALRTYSQGHGDKGKKTWTPVPQVIDALNSAFYTAFDLVEPTNKRWLLGIDVSGSMGSPISGGPISCCEAATALAMVTVHTEPACYPMAFDTGMRPLPISKGMRLDNALQYTRNINGGGTDCSLPMLVALQNRIPVDIFVVLTDSETWAGRIHPPQALNQYRQQMGIGAKLVVVGMCANPFSIADPNDAGCLDVVGFDTTVPSVMSDFARN